MITEEQTEMLTTLAGGLAMGVRTPVLRTPDELGIDYEDVEFQTADGVTVKGWFMPVEGSDKLIISNHFSPGNVYGFAGHLEGLEFAGGFEVNFLPRYKALHDAGYNVLTYSLRNHGDSGEAENGLSGVGYYEWQEVLAAFEYARSRPETADNDVSLYSMCMGANSTLNAIDKHPEAFADVKSMIVVAPLRGRTNIERNLEAMQIDADEGMAAFEEIYTGISGMTVDDHDIIPKAANINTPVYFLQVRDDMNSRWTDVQEMFDSVPVEDKKIEYVEGTPWRFKGYTHHSEHPEAMVEWFDAHTK
ncbi:MAG: alpha/beta hydrolase [Actinomycetota bacterium]